MQAIGETIFDIVYLILVISLGIRMIRSSNGNKQYRLFGITAVVLGCGDAFHLVPRVIALCTTGLENYTAALGIGKFVTSITMTVFYVILYHVWRMRYDVKDSKNLTVLVYILAAARIILCLFPQNGWTSAAAPLSWGIYRNIPFTILGILITVLYYKSARANNDSKFKKLLAGNRNKLWFLSSGCFICRCGSCHRNVYDTKDLCVRMDGTYGI